MSNEAEILPNLLREETFEIVMRGYNRRQVDEYIARTRNQVRDLEARLSRALDETERIRREMAELRDARRPAGDELGERLRQIINLAEEEAQSKVEDADQRVTQIRQEAETEAKRVVDEARGKSEQGVAQAQERADNLVTAARQEAERTITAAKQEAEKTLNDSRLEAERTLTAAERRSAAINEGASERLTGLVEQHSQALRRMNEINQTLSGMLRAEEKAGSLEQMVAEAAQSGRDKPAEQPGRGEAGTASTADPRHAPAAQQHHAQQQHAQQQHAQQQHAQQQQQPPAAHPAAETRPVPEVRSTEPHPAQSADAHPPQGGRRHAPGQEHAVPAAPQQVETEAPTTPQQPERTLRMPPAIQPLPEDEQG